MSRETAPPHLTNDRNIVLTGFMAVGKSVVGKKLALRLKRPFVDLDQQIEAREGIRVAEIFNQKGEAYFRRVEKETLKEILRREGQVVATGGGCIVDAENLRLCKRKGVLICLTAQPSTLLRRIGSGNQRPLLRGGNRLEKIRGLLIQREEAYRQVHFRIDTDRLSVDQVVEQIVEALPTVS